MKTSGTYTLMLTLVMLALPGAVNAEAEVVNEPTVVSYDWGSVDTLEALGLEEHIIGLPYQAAPAYMQHLLEGRTDVGGLKVPDLDAVIASQPQLIVVTGRQGEAVESLANIAEVIDVGLEEGPYFTAFSDKVTGLAERFNAEAEAAEALTGLSEFIEQARASLPEERSVMVITHNDGRFSLRQESVVNELLQLDVPAVPEDVELVQRGERVFTPLTPDIMVRMSPDVVLVVDRSLAIGKEPLDVSTLQSALAERGGESIRVVPLSADLWYLSGAGLGSVRAQVNEVIEAVGR
ncbi:ABC transporter substrate-binding protein [Halomonas halocynthiae]|uniref:ABC transporter substrate-binding protein n=1 Tax=Halomonas halocynthiae TaxID=176290 RepID=UPI00040A86D3|nr:ABC transporter substrate-binding protein [Halomonas halocynthiae]